MVYLIENQSLVYIKEYFYYNLVKKINENFILT